MNSIVVFFAFLGCVVVSAYAYGHHEEDHGPAHYKFGYSVYDPHTGDKKEQHEERDGNGVKGYYTIADPDGTKRIVEYVADHHNGFNAVVKRIGHAHHPQHYHHHGGHGGHGGAGGYGGAHSSVGVTHFGYHY